MNDPEAMIAPTREQCVHFNGLPVCRAGVKRGVFFGQAEPCYGARVQSVQVGVVLTGKAVGCQHFQPREDRN